MSPKFTAYITTHALTQGIKRVENASIAGEARDAIVYGPTHNPIYILGENRDWHRTEMGALSRAHKMRAAKLASLHRQIQRLSTMIFCIID